MRFLYTISILLYTLLIRIASVFNHKAKLWINGRKDILNQIPSKGTKQKRIWIHTASLGEFEQGRPIIEAIKKQNPSIHIHLSFFSPSGYEIRKGYEFADSVSYLPIDTPSRAMKFIQKVDADLAIFIKYEYWYNLMNEMKKADVPMIMASAIFRKNQVFFKPYGFWFAKQLKSIQHFYVQNNASLELLSSLGHTNASLSGDTRFDRVLELVLNPKSFAQIEYFKADLPLFIAGSTWPKDEELLQSTFDKLHKKCKLIIAPHEIDEAHLLNIEKLFSSYKVQRFSTYSADHNPDCQILIIDNIGKLMHLYQYADFAYIGGGFNAGIHNILEAATYGLPTLFGPKHQNFNEALELKKLGGSYSIIDHASLLKITTQLVEDKLLTQKIKGICKDYIEQKQGATKIIISNPIVYNLTHG